MSKLTQENEYFYLLYSKAYEKVNEWQAKMDKAEPDGIEWQIAQQYRHHYAEYCNWLNSNSPSSLGFCKYQKNN